MHAFVSSHLFERYPHHIDASRTTRSQRQRGRRRGRRFATGSKLRFERLDVGIELLQSSDRRGNDFKLRNGLRTSQGARQFGEKMSEFIPSLFQILSILGHCLKREQLKVFGTTTEFLRALYLRSFSLFLPVSTFFHGRRFTLKTCIFLSPVDFEDDIVSFTSKSRPLNSYHSFRPVFQRFFTSTVSLAFSCSNSSSLGFPLSLGCPELKQGFETVV